MTPFSSDDQDLNLVNFLRQHRPEAPPAAADLEQRILRDVEMLQPGSTVIQMQRRRSPLWLVPSVIAAGVVAAVVGYRALIPPPTSPAELAKLERFMENNWHGTVGDSPSMDLFSATDSITDSTTN
jgi:hypothetical protein